MAATNGWGQWSNHVLKELARLNEGLEAVNKEIVSVRVELATLKVKSGLWGMTGAAVPIALMVLMYMLKAVIG
jgi:hypothetical protein